MSDLVKRLRDWSEYDEVKINDARDEAADLIEQLEADLARAAKADHMTATSILLGREIGRLERELAKVQHERNHMVEAHAAEKALAEDIFEAWRVGVEFNPNITLAAYRKARGM